MIGLLWVAGAWNLFTFLMMGVDKSKAKRQAWRIPEKTLLLCAACFGAVGETAGMLFFRHKTLHSRFRYGLPTMLVLQLAVAFALANWMGYV